MSMKTHNDHIVNALECKLLEKEAENKSLKNQVASLSNENNSITSELSKVKMMCNSLINKEGNYAAVQNQLIEKEADIIKLKNEVFDLTRAYNYTQFRSKLQYEKDVTQVRYQQENFVAKVDNATKIEKLNETFYNKILELEGVILSFKEEEQKRIDSLELEHQNKIASFRKKMIDYLKSDNRNKQNSTQQSELNAKLTNLHISELINELEFQSCLIENLIKENDVLKKKILGLTNDIKIHCEVENCLGEKNKKFQRQLQIISKPMESPLTTSTNNNMMKNIKSNSYYNLRNNGNKSEDMRQSKTFQLQKDLIFKEKQIENWRTKYDTAKSKLDLLNKKYSEIGKLCDDALTEIYLTKETKIDEIYLSLEQFKQCDFNKMSQEQKYAALVIIIKYILPLVNKEVVLNGVFNNNVEQVQTKVYLDRNQGNHKALSSDSDFTYLSSTAMTETGNIIKNKLIKNVKYVPLSELKYKVKKPSFKIAKGKIDFHPFSILNMNHD